jgi:hypothetical protein
MIFSLMKKGIEFTRTMPLGTPRIRNKPDA